MMHKNALLFLLISLPECMTLLYTNVLMVNFGDLPPIYRIPVLPERHLEDGEEEDHLPAPPALLLGNSSKLECHMF